MHDVTLMATANNWRLFMLRKADPAFLAYQKKIHHRDHYTCQFCGFQAEDRLETINLNANYLDNKRANLAAACVFCAQCFFLEAVGKSDFGGGALIYLPEMSQAALNALCHVLFSSMVFHLRNTVHAKNIYRSLKLRAQTVEEKIGEGFSNPNYFGQLLVDADSMQYAKLQEAASVSLRLLPNMARFSGEIIQWAASGLQRLQREKE